MENTFLAYSRHGLMLHEALLGRVRGLLAERRRRLEALRTRASAEAYVRAVRRAVRRAFGPFPPRTPLNVRKRGTVEGGNYAIEKLVYESRPGYLVTANLYVPAGASARRRAPAVLFLCGHSGNGKAHDVYQAACHDLAARGFLLLAVDPVEQGERRQYDHLPEKERPNLCEAHNLYGNQQVLLGDFFGAWRAWDAIRGLDLLLARPEADSTRVGVTGNSGGGTLTAYVAALDPRPTMVAPSCYICSYEANLQNELPSDAEQNPPGFLAAGFDQADLLLAYAPRPTLVLGQWKDFFDVRFTRQAVEEIDRVHRLLGSRGTAAFFSGPTEHGFSRENREAMTAFFMKHAGIRGSAREEAFQARSCEDLAALPPGGVVKAGSLRIHDLIRAEAAAWRRRRGKPAPDAVRRAALRILGIERPASPPRYRILRSAYGTDVKPEVHGQFGLETEPGILATVTCLTPGGGSMHPAPGDALLYVGHESSHQDACEREAVRRLARKGEAFFTVDPRGIGISRPSTCVKEPFRAPYGADYLYASTHEMLGDSLLGRRVFDVLAAIDFLLENGSGEVRLAGRGFGAVTAAFAALLHPEEPRVHLLDYLPSFESLAADELARWPLSQLPRGVLRAFDLPDVYRALGRRLTKARPWDARLTERKP